MEWYSALPIDLTHTWVWFLVIFIFIIGYYFIAREEKYHINKAKPALFIGTLSFLIIWIHHFVSWIDTTYLNNEVSHLIIEISEIFFFLLVAMTFIEVMVDRGVFNVLRKNLVSKWYSYKKLFWIIWFIAFFLSPIADNLTTALILSTVLAALSKDKKFLVVWAVSIVVAANAGWAWSPFGDITTLMAWTAGKWSFSDFITLFPSAFIWWLVTAFFLSFFLPSWKLESTNDHAELKPAAKKIIFLGVFTIVISILTHQFLHLPAMWWMMFGLSLLQLCSYKLKKSHWEEHSFNIFHSIKKTEVDTLLFFFWILSAVWALAYIGYLTYIVQFYDVVGITAWNISVWMISAIIDNIPVMSAVLKSNMDMTLDWWLMLTLAVWIWGSLISFGSAAWVWVMAKLKGVYTFNTHMKFFPIVLLGYSVSIWIFYLQVHYFNLF